MKKEKIVKIGITALFALILVSCPTPFTENILLHIKDTTGPVISITSPAEGDYCAKTVVVTGTVTDTSAEGEAAGEVGSLSYSILSTDMTGDIVFGEEGAFTFEFETTNLDTTFVLQVSAEDWNGNTGSLSITLNTYEDDDIPSFHATPGNETVTLEWDAVPNTASYDLYYSTNGTQPSENYGNYVSGVTSPYILANLENGNMHVFRLKAVPEEDSPENWSDFEKAIPLSGQTLAPKVTGKYGKIVVEWFPIAAATEFEVLRSLNRESGFINITGTLTGTTFTDTGVEDGVIYYYRVNPAFSDEIVSVPNGVETSPFAEEPYAVREVATASSAVDMAVSGNHAYIAELGGGLQIIDISNPASASVVKTVDSDGWARGVAVSGNYMYVADDSFITEEGLQLYNISVPASASLAYYDNTPTDPWDLAISGDYVYVADKNYGLRIFEIDHAGGATPLTPVLTSSAWDVEISGNYAYVAGATYGIYIIDITSPTSATLEHTVDTDGLARGLAVSGNYLYVADDSNGVEILGITTPTSASIVHGVSTSVGANDVTISGTLAYVSTGNGGVEVLDISDPTSASIVKTIPTIEANDAVVKEDYIYIADGDNGCQVYNIQSPDSSSMTRKVATSNPQGVAVSGDYAYIADADAGMRIIDISAPASASVVKTIATSGYAWGVAVQGSHAYLADGSGGLQIIDVDPPASASVVTSIEMTSDAVNIALWGSYALVAAGESGIQIVDISTPASPSLVRRIPTSWSYGVDVSGDYAYVADGSSGLRIIDLTTPASASVIKTVDTDGNGLDIAVSGDYAYIADGSSGVQVIDISDPSSASIVHTVPTPGTRDTNRYIRCVCIYCR